MATLVVVVPRFVGDEAVIIGNTRRGCSIWRSMNTTDALGVLIR
ncbi:hypothetical protein AB0C01_23430 [Micromonospora sp. NPDC048905]